MRCVCADLCARLPEFAHVEMHRVAVAIRRTRKRVSHGLQASLTPLRFAGGRLVNENRRGRWTIQRVFDSPGGQEYLYLLNFYLPRFLNQSFDEKLITIVHELWHIGPAFDGDLRRHNGRCYIHTGRQSAYDAWAGELSRRWLAHHPPPELYAFLQFTAEDLFRRHGGIVGAHIPAPKLIRTL